MGKAIDVDIRNGFANMPNISEDMPSYVWLRPARGYTANYAGKEGAIWRVSSVLKRRGLAAMRPISGIVLYQVLFGVGNVYIVFFRRYQRFFSEQLGCRYDTVL